ncbi:MAG: M18 family aminopeptidase [Gammaproteobacteria bacterium]
MSQEKFTSDLLDFIEDSPTPFHAVQNMVSILRENGFAELRESDQWSLLPGQNYYVTRNGTSIIAFRTSANDVVKSGVRMVGAHTDSPCLKVKPSPEITQKGYLQLGVEVYGGALFSPWFDRDLSLAGRVNYVTKYRQLETALIDFKDPIAVIPSLAIHLDRKVNEERNINPQKELPPVVMQLKEEEVKDFRELLKQQMLSDNPESAVEEVLDYDLYFYDTQAPAIVGLEEEFICSARLDNLLSCFVGMVSLMQADNKYPSLLVCNDHEEVGSMSAIGAQGPFLKSVLERLAGDAQKLSRMIDQSLLISADNAHGVHPNYVDKHDDSHGPLLNKGPVIKVNANQRYATNSRTSALFRYLCNKVEVPVQSFSIRSDMACGSTIGPITAAELGVQTLDVGVPQFAMHSVRETAGAKDAYYLFQVLKEFYANDFDMD